VESGGTGGRGVLTEEEKEEQRGVCIAEEEKDGRRADIAEESVSLSDETISASAGTAKAPLSETRAISSQSLNTKSGQGEIDDDISNLASACESSIGGLSSWNRLHIDKMKDERSKPWDPDDDSDVYTQAASPDSDFEHYDVLVDPEQDDRAVDIPLYSASRPHMRAFHLAWTAFFVSFFTWFAMTPLLSEIARTLDLDHEQIWTSSVLAVASSAITRVVMGPLCDRFGARWVLCCTLIAGAIPTGLAGWLVQDDTSLYLVRLFIGVAGSSLVTVQYWTSSMFTVEVAGTANALAAGWGNLAGGVCQIVMGTLLFPLFKVIYGGHGYHKGNREEDELDDNEQDKAGELSWRTILIFPAVASIMMAWVVIRYGDDTPKGNVSSRKTTRERVSLSDSFRQAVNNRNTWLLFVHYGCSFGVEVTMTQAAALYFQDQFGQSTESAAAIASIFGWMNLFARGIGGFCSDMANARSGVRGRLWCQALMLVCEGALVVCFSYTSELSSAIVTMVFFSIFVQAAEGSTFGIVPYVDASVTGSVVGIVGAGGPVGGVCFALTFRALGYHSAFLWMGCAVMVSAVLTLFVAIPGHRGLLTGHDTAAILEHRRKAKLPEVIVFERLQPNPTDDAIPATANVSLAPSEEHGVGTAYSLPTTKEEEDMEV
jgi:NNP family nitrate/nitrite transporter-like MFS transporter